MGSVPRVGHTRHWGLPAAWAGPELTAMARLTLCCVHDHLFIMDKIPVLHKINFFHPFFSAYKSLIRHFSDHLVKSGQLFSSLQQQCKFCRLNTIQTLACTGAVRYLAYQNQVFLYAPCHHIKWMLAILLSRLEQYIHWCEARPPTHPTTWRVLVCTPSLIQIGFFAAQIVLLISCSLSLPLIQMLDYHRVNWLQNELLFACNRHIKCHSEWPCLIITVCYILCIRNCINWTFSLSL